MKEEPVKIAQLLALLRASWGGTSDFLAPSLDVAIAEAVVRARRVGKPAAVGLTLTFVPKGDQIEVVADLRGKLPEPSNLSLQLFVNRAGQLVDQDPGQAPLFSISEGGAS